LVSAALQQHQHVVDKEAEILTPSVVFVLESFLSAQAKRGGVAPPTKHKDMVRKFYVKNKGE
jgi:hypothetical protein